MSDTKHQLDCLQRRWGDFQWAPMGGRVIRCFAADDEGWERPLFDVIGPGGDQDKRITQWHVKPSGDGPAALRTLGPGAPSAVRAVEEWAWAHPAIRLLGIDGEARRISELEAEIATLRAQLAEVKSLAIEALEMKIAREGEKKDQSLAALRRLLGLGSDAPAGDRAQAGGPQHWNSMPPDERGAVDWATVAESVADPVAAVEKVTGLIWSSPKYVADRLVRAGRSYPFLAEDDGESGWAVYSGMVSEHDRAACIRHGDASEPIRVAPSRALLLAIAKGQIPDFPPESLRVLVDHD